MCLNPHCLVKSKSLLFPSGRELHRPLLPLRAVSRGEEVARVQHEAAREEPGPQSEAAQEDQGERGGQGPVELAAGEE